MSAGWHGQWRIRTHGLPEPARELGGLLLAQIAELEVKIAGLETDLNAGARQDEEAARLMTI